MNPDTNILIIDSDDNIAELLCVNLRSEGYNVERLRSADEVPVGDLGAVRMVIVDSMTEDFTGLDLVYEIKDNPLTEHVAVIVCSAIRSERLIIDVLDAGADDYVSKPFSLRELIARVKVILRRSTRTAGAPRSQLTLGDITIDLPSQTVRRGSNVLTLSKTEYAILLLLVKNVNTYVSRMEIHRSVWNEENAAANERIVDTNISRLRKKLGDDGNRITNRTGHGYMIS